MTRFLGGPETAESLAQRHADYLELWDGGDMRMFRVSVDGAVAGYAGWWDEEHNGNPVYEIGCVIEPAWQGRGVASAALSEVVRLAAATGSGRAIVGYANVDNAASNALCERVGFTLVGNGAFPSDDGEPRNVGERVDDRHVGRSGRGESRPLREFRRIRDLGPIGRGAILRASADLPCPHRATPKGGPRGGNLPFRPCRTDYRLRPCPKRNSGSAVSNGTSGRDASTAAIERGRSNGSRPFGSAAPVSTSSSAPAFAPQFSDDARPPRRSASRMAGRSGTTSTTVGTAAATSRTCAITSAG